MKKLMMILAAGLMLGSVASANDCLYSEGAEVCPVTVQPGSVDPTAQLDDCLYNEASDELFCKIQDVDPSSIDTSGPTDTSMDGPE